MYGPPRRRLCLDTGSPVQAVVPALHHVGGRRFDVRADQTFQIPAQGLITLGHARIGCQRVRDALSLTIGKTVVVVIKCQRVIVHCFHLAGPAFVYAAF